MNRSSVVSAPPLRVLSLDGGGVRGKSSLLILDRIMETLRRTQGLEAVPRPCDHFDLIGGTSTGGIIAIMLGRLGMTVDECIRAYDKVAQTAFTPKRVAFPVSPRGAYSATALEGAIKQTVREFCVESPCVDQRRQGQSTLDSCTHENVGFRSVSCTKTVVLAITKANVDAAPTLFTTYDTDANSRYRDCAIWQVARATSAATTFFKSIKVGRDNVEFIDAGFGYNNPCEVLIKEAQQQFPTHGALQVLSIGTGLGDVITINDSRRTILKALAKMASASTTVARKLDDQYRASGQYHRFNVGRGLQDITLSDWDKTSEISAHTFNYLEDHKDAIKNAYLARHYIPLPKNQHFVGRTDTLELLNGKLFARDGHRRVCLHGLGGVGKTQVALQIAYEAKDARGLMVLWLPAVNHATFQQACTIALKRLVIPVAKDEDPKELLKEYLNSDESGEWLLVIDNIDDMETLRGSLNQSGIDNYLPDNENGRVLFTTRPYDVAIRVADDDDIVKLGKMSHTDARRYLEGRIQPDQIEDDAAAAELLNQLAHLPLAITQATAYMKRNKKPIRAYLDLLRRTESDMADLMSAEFVDRTRYDRTWYEESQNAVALTWQVSFNQICDVDTIAANLLRFISRVEPKSIPRSMLPIEGSETQLDHAIGTLLGYAFLDVREGGEMYDMHSLIHLATRTWVNSQGYEEKAVVDAVGHLANVFPTDDWENRYMWRQYLPHALRLLHKDNWRSKDSAKLGYWVGRCLQKDGQSKDAVRIHQGIVSALGKTLAESHPNRLASEHGLATAYLYQGGKQVLKAVELLEHVVSIQNNTLAESHHDRLASQQVLAWAYLKNKQVLKAVELLEHVSIQNNTLAESHHDRLALQHGLAWAYLDQGGGQRLKAVELLEHVVSIQNNTLAESHPDRLASQHGLAIAYLYQGGKQVLKAVELLEHVVSIQNNTLAESHHNRLASQQVLAWAYLDQGGGQVLKAVELLEHVVSIQNNTLAESHPDRLLSQHELATAYLDQAGGQVLKAVELLEHVVSIQNHTLAESDPDRLASQHGLATAYLDQGGGQVLKAVELLEHVVSIQNHTLAESDPSRLASERALGIAYYTNGQVQKGIERLEHVVLIQKTTLAEDDFGRLRSERALQRARANCTSMTTFRSWFDDLD
ncbi:hypothetical protein F4859DRAFT_506728 [Xylaria cf. heliscus]|nr:hypothetical protein F4859DRAFT_506728 [Xylaria cf. heliscus]